MLERMESTNPLVSSKTKLAALISAIVNPVLVSVFAASVFVFYNLNSLSETIHWMFITLSITAGLPIAYVAYLVKTGYLGDIYMPDREKRIKPIIVILLWLFVSLFILKLLHAPLVMLLLVEIIAGQLVLLGLVTTLWKISFHSATIMSATAVAAVLHSELVFAFSLLVPIVGWARVQLKRHTLMQVIMGGLVGGIVSLVTFLFVLHKLTL